MNNYSLNSQINATVTSKQQRRHSSSCRATHFTHVPFSKIQSAFTLRARSRDAVQLLSVDTNKTPTTVEGWETCSYAVMGFRQEGSCWSTLSCNVLMYDGAMPCHCWCVCVFTHLGCPVPQTIHGHACAIVCVSHVDDRLSDGLDHLLPRQSEETC